MDTPLPRLRSSQSAGPDERVRVEARARVDPHRLILASPLSPQRVCDRGFRFGGRQRGSRSGLIASRA